MVLSPLAGIGLASAPSASASTPGVYLALGDSFASGEGNPPWVTGGAACHRSVYSYPEIDRSLPQSPPSFQSWACTGATTGQFLYTGSHGEATQISKVNAQDTMVTLTLSGDDLGFAKVLEFCIEPQHLNCENAEGAAVANAEIATRKVLPTVYSQILSKAATNAQVFVVGYPQFLVSSANCTAHGLAGDEVAWINATTKDWDGQIQSVVKSMGNSRIHYVDTFNLFAGGQACSGASVAGTGKYVNGIEPDIQYSFHPNQAGQKLLASALAGAVRSFPPPKTITAPTPPPPPPPPPTPPSAYPGPVYTVMNTSETLPDGIWFRSTPNTANAIRVTGDGVYRNEQVQLHCYAWGDSVGPYNDTLWYYASNVSRPTVAGVGANVGYINAHYINDGKVANQVDAVPAC